jgi:hypothetical protein
VAAGRTSEHSELVLQADHINVADIQEAGGAEIRRKILVIDFKTDSIRILIAGLNIVHRDREALARRVLGCYSGKQVGSKCGDTALSRQVISDKCNSANLRTFDRECVISIVLHVNTSYKFQGAWSDHKGRHQALIEHSVARTA